MQQLQPLWNDEYDDILNSEVHYHKAKLNMLSKEDWEYILKVKKVDLFNRKDIALSLLTTNKLNQAQLIELLPIFGGFPQEPIANPQEPKAEHIEQIDRDIGRTFQTNPFFKDIKNQLRLRQLLLNYAECDEVVGYSQGMNYIAATLVYFNIPDEFLLFKHIIVAQRYNYINGTPGLFQNLAKLQFKIKAMVPRLHDHFKAVGMMDLGVCFSHHFLTIMLQNTPDKFKLLILNLYLLRGENIIHKLLIAMLSMCQNIIIDMTDVQVISKFIRRDLISYFFEELQRSRDNWQLLKLLFKLNLVKKKMNPI